MIAERRGIYEQFQMVNILHLAFTCDQKLEIIVKRFKAFKEQFKILHRMYPCKEKDPESFIKAQTGIIFLY
jgi:hypothetical protein